MSFDIAFFFIVGVVAIASAIMMITRSNPVLSVLWLIVNFFCIALLYLSLHAQFIAIIQILVYAGAIMVLFLFVIMLLNVGEEERHSQRFGPIAVVSALLVAAVCILILPVVAAPFAGGNPLSGVGSLGMGTVESVGMMLFHQYLVPFEATSLLLLAAMVGVIVLAKKKFD
jgi:NADH-quinone oxidoreductase subunit J